MLRLSVILLLCTIVQVQGTCLDGYSQFSGTSKCFALKPTGAAQTRVTWDEASAQCALDVGATLASIHSLNDQVYLNVFLKTASQSDGVWMGLSDTAVDGEYRWPDDTNTSGYNNWDLNQPDDNIPAGQRCVRLVPDDRTPGLWKTFQCNVASTPYFLCEIAPTDNTDPVQPSCPVDGSDADYFVYDGACFKITSSGMSSADAEEACRATGTNAHLATVSNAYHNNAIRLLLLGAGETTSWIGLRSTRGAFTWIDRSQLVVYTNWAAREPQPSDTKSCVSTDGDMWTTEDCEGNMTAICSISLDEGPERPQEGECPAGWSFIGLYEFCVQYVSEGMNWTAALQECTARYPFASLYAPHREMPINWAEYEMAVGTEFWLAMRRNEDDRYQMADGSAIDYVNWANNQPCCWDSNQDCVVGTVQASDALFEWSGRDCDLQKPFFCVFPSITGPPPYGECQEGWFKLGQKCYGYFPEEVTFGEARSNCESNAIGGHLAAISYASLQDMLVYFMKSYAKNVWIGLLDTTNNKEFKWTNGDSVLFTNWAPGQPDGYLDFFDETEYKNDCGMMMADPITPGLWDDVSCGGTKLPYLCESYIDPVIAPQPPPNSCPPGYIEDFYGSCYTLLPFNLEYDNALAACQSNGSSLASIADGYEQGFLQYVMTVFSDIPTSLWIGINDRDGDGEYTNTDGTPVTYVNWLDTNSPQAGMCVAAQKGSKWLESNCTEGRAAICKIPAAPVTPAPRETHCDEGWIKYEGDGLCYLINTYRLPDDLTDTVFVSYADAKRLCKTQGATLASIHTAAQNDWLYKVSRVTLGQRNIWIGMHRSTEGMLQWDDGSVVNYIFWDEGEPSSGQEGTDCVSLFAGNDGVGPWKDERCFKLNAFICQKPANDGPEPQCEPEWQFGGQNCFYFAMEMMSWEEAEMSCNQMGSNLASLDDEVERRNLSTILIYELPEIVEYWPWIGFRRLPNAADFTWSDGTPTSSDERATSWSLGQPDSDDDDCAVIELKGTYEEWNDINCGLSRPFICKKAPDSPGLPTPAMTQEPQGGCQSDGTRIGTHCYKMNWDPLNWDAARTECAKFPNGDLASIPIYAVQALMASLQSQVPVDSIWIGLTSRMPNSDFVRVFHWIDGSTLNFQNWGAGQPSLPTDEDNCVKMLTDPDAPGKWYDDDCSKEYTSVCKYDLDPNSQPVPPATFAPCPNGYSGSAPSCFRIETTERTFSNAMDACTRVGGILAPVMDGYENAFTELLMYNSGIESAWVGLRSDSSTSGTYEWISDQWPKKYLNWAGQEPVLELGCAASMYSEGWKSMGCTTARPSICRSNQDIPPTFPPVGPGLECPENWYPFENQCYLIDTGFTSDNLLNTYFKCATISALPPSIHSRDENTFIRINSLNEKTGKFVWIGLVTQGGTYAWMDGSVVDFTYWADGEEPTPNDGKECVAMVPELDGRWQRKECSLQAEVVCMLFEPSIPTATTKLTDKPEPPTDSVVTEQPPILSTGAIVGISVGGAAILLLFIIWLCYFCEKQMNNRKEWEQHQREDNIDVDYGVENVQYSEDIELRKKKPEQVAVKVETESDGSEDSSSVSSGSSGGSGKGASGGKGAPGGGKGAPGGGKGAPGGKGSAGGKGSTGGEGSAEENEYEEKL
ncbi:macrophage mannose receptor 1-like isoform X2 [Patiria miniata]|uniref:C-type lectin domain-containing protein n=1 Tax=Patiria miniata TaxID=46514 RepID=A0A914A3L5_PATMI|nr:macrophage mannose receptor 1-like isoform X2 [Patiria miniata]